jgi:CHAD domain-containing protein
MPEQVSTGTVILHPAEALLLKVRRRAIELHEARGKCRRSLTDRSVYALRQASRHLASPLEVAAASGPGDRKVRRVLRLTSRILKLTSTLRDLHVLTLLVESEVQDEALREKLLRHLRKAQGTEERCVAKGLKTIRTGPILRLDTGFRPALSALEVEQGLLSAVAHHQERLIERIAGLRRTDPRTLHRARVALKRTRYLLDALPAHLPADHAARHAALAQLQKQLGRWHDGHLFSEWLLEQRKELPPELCARCGTLARKHQRHGAKAARALVARLQRGTF